MDVKQWKLETMNSKPTEKVILHRDKCYGRNKFITERTGRSTTFDEMVREGFSDHDELTLSRDIHNEKTLPLRYSVRIKSLRL